MDILYFTSTGKSSGQLSLKENVAKVIGGSSCGGLFCSFRWTNTLLYTGEVRAPTSSQLTPVQNVYND